MGKQKRDRFKLASNRVRERLDEIGMCQQELSDLMDVNRSHISRIVTGKSKCISLPMAIKLAEVLKTPVEELFKLKKNNEKAEAIKGKNQG